MPPCVRPRPFDPAIVVLGTVMTLLPPYTRDACAHSLSSRRPCARYAPSTEPGSPCSLRSAAIAWPVSGRTVLGLLSSTLMCSASPSLSGYPTPCATAGTSATLQTVARICPSAFATSLTAFARFLPPGFAMLTAPSDKVLGRLRSQNVPLYARSSATPRFGNCACLEIARPARPICFGLATLRLRTG